MSDPKNVAAKQGPGLKNIIILVAVVLIAFLIGRQFIALTKSKHAPGVVPRPVSMATATQKDVRVFISAFGNMATLNNTDVKSQVTGEIKEIRFKDGDEVKQGDVLFVIDSSLYKADLDKASAAVAQDEVDLKMKKDTLARNQQLMGKNLISQQDFEKYETDVESAQSKLLLDKASADTARINLNYCTVIAPITGLTSKRQVDVGNIITANSGPVLVNIKTIDPLYTDFTISENDFKPVQDAFNKEQLDVLVRPSNSANGSREGKLIFLDNAVNNTTGTVALRALVPNSDRYFWPGQFVRVKLVLSVLKDAVLVPTSAIQVGQNGNYLFAVKEDGTADLRFVKIGPVDGDFTVVTENVKPGEKIVTSGVLMLRTGTPIMEASAMAQAAAAKEKGKEKHK